MFANDVRHSPLIAERHVGGTTTHVIVVGAGGNVGRPLVRALLEAGSHVRALMTQAVEPSDAFPELLPPPSASRLTCVRFDFLDPRTFDGAFTASPAGGQPSLFLLRPPAISDIDAIAPAIDAAVAAGVRHVVFLSIQGAHHNPLVPHHAIERHLEKLASVHLDLSVTFLRAAFFMQNLSTTHAADIRERNEVLVPAGGGRTAFVDARDVAAAAAVVLTAPWGASHRVTAYELTGREVLTYTEVAAVLSRVLGRSIAYTSPSMVRFYRSMRARGYARAYVAVMLAVYTTARVGLAAHRTDDLEHLLGRPPLSFERFAEEHTAAWQ